MSNDEMRAYLESVWERHVEWQQVTPEQGVLNGFGEIYHGAVDTFPQPESAAWSAAAAFTEARMEEIRQVKEEIEEIIDSAIGYMKIGAKCGPAYQRILAREQSALAELSQGIRAEKLKEMGVEL